LELQFQQLLIYCSLMMLLIICSVKALEKCQLATAIRLKDEKLDAPVAENGDNWSMGQRQLFCLGRVLLKSSRVLVLDEATASIDTQTDVILQRIIKTEFSNCTIISIAHRIPSVMDSDKVLVLDAGTVKEFGKPSNLLENPESLFSLLVQEYWSRSNNTAPL
jgi:ABC-type multidrug transport system fused ATPase/permease subunit